MKEAGKRSKFIVPIKWDYRWPREDKHCLECDTLFNGTPKGLYCSIRCARRHNKRIFRLIEKYRNRGIKIVDNVDPILVFNAHNWQCSSCDTHTPRTLLGSDSLQAPTLDHIIPLSKAGEHSYNNTQLLCRLCNMTKGTSVGDPIGEGKSLGSSKPETAGHADFSARNV